jgi:CubicO group peptidase (beta-lactamase class C family)
MSALREFSADLPKYADLRTPEKDQITLRNLLTMSAGLEWQDLDTPYGDSANSENRMDHTSDPCRYPPRHAPMTAALLPWSRRISLTTLIRPWAGSLGRLGSAGADG